MASKNTLQILINAKDNTAKTFKSLNSRLKEAEGHSKRFAVGLAAIGGGTIFFGKTLLTAAGDFEQTEIAFTTMLGSAEKANKLLRELADFAKKTPFELKDVEKGAKGLLAFGISEEKILPTLKSLGDVSAGLDVPMERLILNYGQVAAQTKLTGREMRDFAIAGVPLLGELADMLGKSKSEIQDMVSSGEVGFPIVEEAFKRMSSEGGKFANLMDEQSKSLGGMVSNLRDAWDLFLRNEGAALLDWGKKFVSWAIHIVEDVLPKVITTIKEVSQWFRENKVAIVIVAGAITGALLPAIYGMIVAFAAAAMALAPFMIGGAIIAGLVYGIISIAKNWEQTKDSIKFIWEVIKEIWGNATTWVKEKIDDLIGWFRDLIKNIKDAISWFDKFSLKNVGQAFRNLPANLGFGGGRAVGGPVSADTGYVVGEQGPELFIPSSGGQIIPNQGLGRKIIINITDNTFLDEYAAEKMGDMIINKLGMSERFAT